MANINTPRLVVAAIFALVAKTLVGCTPSLHVHTGENFNAPEPLIRKMESTCGEMLRECKMEKDDE